MISMMSLMMFHRAIVFIIWITKIYTSRSCSEQTAVERAMSLVNTNNTYPVYMFVYKMTNIHI